MKLILIVLCLAACSQQPQTVKCDLNETEYEAMQRFPNTCDTSPKTYSLKSEIESK